MTMARMAVPYYTFPPMMVLRPIVRQFKSQFTREIAAHVRGGGHAVVWDKREPGKRARARLVFPLPKEGDDGDFAVWALLDMGKSGRWTEIDRGPLRGLGTSLVPADCHDIVRHRAERDSIHEGTQREMNLDCLKCGACCTDNEVILHDVDVERLRDGGRADLTRPPFARKKDGKLVLTLLESKNCRHLGGDNKCGIYALRPDSCSTFPVASECCLFAREEELGIVDGVKPS
jgi:Fe-S-cluster containining protein